MVSIAVHSPREETLVCSISQVFTRGNTRRRTACHGLALPACAGGPSGGARQWRTLELAITASFDRSAATLRSRALRVFVVSACAHRRGQAEINRAQRVKLRKIAHVACLQYPSASTLANTMPGCRPAACRKGGRRI